MNWLDFVILSMLVWFTATAFLRGIIRETVGLAAAVLGVVLAGLFHVRLSENLLLFIDSQTAADVGGFLAIFGVVVGAGWVLSLLLRTSADLLFLGWADHAGGAVFGLIKGVLVVQALAVLFLLRPALGLETAIQDSTIGAFFMDTAPVVRALLPAEFDTAIQNFTG